MNGCKLCHMSTKTYRAFIRKKYEEKQNEKNPENSGNFHQAPTLKL